MNSFDGRLPHWSLGPAVLGLLIFMSGCGPSTASPGVKTISVSKDGLYATFIHWENGGMLMVVDDVGPHGGKGRDSGEGGYAFTESVGENSGPGYKWSFASPDSKAATFRIDGEEYDLSKGALFVVAAKGEHVEVHQLQRDLSTIRFDSDVFQEFIEKDVDIQKVLGAGDVPK